MARLLGLEAKPNGGAALERLALQGDDNSIKFSLPLRKFKDCNFSYAGTKTAVRLATESKLPEGPSEQNTQVCYAPTTRRHGLQGFTGASTSLSAISASLHVHLPAATSMSSLSV